MATLETFSGSNKKYLNITQGAFRQKVAEWTEWATIRELKDKDWNPTWETRTEMVYNKLTWKITDISFYDWSFGKVLNIWIDDEIVVSIPVNNDVFIDIAKKLPKVDFDKEITLIPWEMEVANNNPKTKKQFPTKKKRWVVVNQNWEKIIWDYYGGYDADAKKFTYKNWMPKPTKEEQEDSDLMKSYFIRSNKFLQKEIEKLAEKVKPFVKETKEPENDDISVDDLPF